MKNKRADGWDGVLVRVAFHKGVKVVEIGSGSGDDSLKLQDLGAIVMPVDNDPKHIQSAREKGLHLAYVGDMRHLCVEDGWADVAFSANSLVCLDTDEDIARAIGEMVRVVKPGGLIVICTNYLTTTKQPCREIAYFQTHDGLLKAVSASGLRIEAANVVHIPEKLWDPDYKYLVIEAKRTGSILSEED